SYARDLGGKGVELIHHRIDGVLQLQDLSPDIDGDLLREVPVCHGRRDLGDVAHLTGEVTRHRVDAVRQVLPGAGDAPHLRLPAQLPFRADLPGDAGDFGGKGAELVHHRVHGARRPEELAGEGAAVDLQAHRLREVALRHRAD